MSINSCSQFFEVGAGVSMALTCDSLYVPCTDTLPLPDEEAELEPSDERRGPAVTRVANHVEIRPTFTRKYKRICTNEGPVINKRFTFSARAKGNLAFFQSDSAAMMT